VSQDLPVYRLGHENKSQHRIGNRAGIATKPILAPREGQLSDNGGRPTKAGLGPARAEPGVRFVSTDADAKTGDQKGLGTDSVHWEL